MDNVTVTCMQPRFSVLGSREEFEALARRFLRQAQTRSAQLSVFPELTGLLLASPLISHLKLGLAQRADRGRKPGAGFLARRLGRLAGTTASVLGGGVTGSLQTLLASNSDGLRDLYLETFRRLAREFGVALIAGSLYLYDTETRSVRNRAFLFDAAGEVIGWQDKLNLTPAEREWVAPGTDLVAFQVPFGRLGILIGWDALYPELARLLAVQRTDLLVGIAAVPGAAQSGVVRAALAMRAQENQLYTAASFLLGPSYFDGEAREDYAGQSALLAPIALTEKSDGILGQVGSPQAESVVSAALDMEALRGLRSTSDFQPRQQMNLGNLGGVLAEMYRRGLTVEQSIEQGIAGVPEVAPAAPAEESPVTAEGKEPPVPVEAVEAADVETTRPEAGPQGSA
jgi:predicted amidohydrolase